LAGTSKNYQAEEGGRFEKQLALPRSRLMQSETADKPAEPEREAGKHTPAPACVGREEAPVKEDTPVAGAVKKEGRGRPRKISGEPWAVAGVSRRTWERRQAKARQG
jgi:hypothetical protein